MVHSISGVPVQCKNFTLRSNPPAEVLKVILAQAESRRQVITRPLVV